MKVKIDAIQKIIEAFVNLCKPDHVVLCNGTKEEYQHFLDLLVKATVATPLKKKGCYYFRSDPKDVARTESSTFVCSEKKDDAGPTNNWIDPRLMKKRLFSLFDGSMKGRTMYVIPYLMGNNDCEFSKVGIEVTDSLYVCVNMFIMSRMGKIALDRIEKGEKTVIGLHSVGAPLKDGQKDSHWPCNEEKVIAHFPETKEIFSFGSGYGGNALLGKKCFALRIGSCIAKEEGSLAEHMLIIGVTNPKGKKKYFAAAFPSSCGKTNLALIKSDLPGWKVECVGDDIAWMKFGKDKQLYAINPENGFFGVAPGTSWKTNPHAMEMIQKDTLFTNVALNGDDVWWEGMSDQVPDGLIDWNGKVYKKESGEKAAHPNARFTTPISSCPTLDPGAKASTGVPISGIIFGGRRGDLTPLVMEAKDWTMGTLYGAALSSEKTAAAEGIAGEMRHDPFAMLPFCGYHMADYFQHWLSMEEKDPSRKLPKIFSVNWFRKDGQGRFLWPGYSMNMHVIKWMFESIDNDVEKVKTPFGFLPKNMEVEGVDKKVLKDLLSLDENEYKKEMSRIRSYFVDTFGAKVPKKILDLLDNLV